MRGRIVPILLFGFIHLVFIIGIVYPKWGWFSLIGLIPLLGYSQFSKNEINYSLKEHLISIILFFVGFFITKVIVVFGGVSTVYGSAITGALFAFTKIKYLPNLSALIYAGSFAAMLFGKPFSDVWVVVSICLIGGSMFHLLKDNFNGLGGKLGSIGFGALIVPLIILESYYFPIGSIKLGFSTKYQTDNSIRFFLISVGSLLVTTLVYKIHNSTKWNAIAASSLVTIFTLLILEFIGMNLPSLAGAVFGASFVGMSSKEVLKFPFLIVSAVVFGFGFYLMYRYLQGFGGTLGTIACLSCLTGVLIQKAFQSKSVRV